MDGRSDGGESRVMSGHRLDLPRERKLDLGIVELLDARAAALVRRNLFHLDDLEKERGD